jgi:hypothetical protein
VRTLAYRNLTRGGWSIKQVVGGKGAPVVVGHCDALVLNNVKPHVGGSHDRIRAAATREVFAWLVGELVSVEGFVSFQGREAFTVDAFPLRPINRCERVTFHPFSAVKRGFIWADNGEAFTGASCAHYTANSEVFAL